MYYLKQQTRFSWEDWVIAPRIQIKSVVCSWPFKASPIRLQQIVCVYSQQCKTENTFYNYLTKTEIWRETARASFSSKFRPAKVKLQKDWSCFTIFIIWQDFSVFVCICRMNEMRRETEVETDRKEKGIPNKLRLRRGGGGGVGGCGVFAPRREISTSTRETVSPGARKVAGGGKIREGKKSEIKMQTAEWEKVCVSVIGCCLVCAAECH